MRVRPHVPYPAGQVRPPWVFVEVKGLRVGPDGGPPPPGARLTTISPQSTLSLSTVANEAPNNLGVKRPTSR